MCSRDTWRKFNAMTPRGKDAEKSGIESVAVGFPNPSGEETKPLRWMPCLEFWCAAALSPSGATCI